MANQGERQFNAIDFNQIPFIESVFELLPADPTTSPDSGPVPNGRFYYNTVTNAAYCKTPSGWAPMTGLQKKVFKIGDGTSTSFNVVHNLGSQDLSVTVRLTAYPYSLVNIDVDFASSNTITITSGLDTPLSNDFLTVTIIG